MKKIIDTSPEGGFILNKILAFIICQALKSETFYTIVSRCLEKQGKKIMSEVDIGKKTLKS